ncbi:sulfatase [Planctomycetota bacterium]
MDRRNFLKKSAVSIGAFGLSNELASVLYAADRIKPPNILWLVAEDLCPDLACYGAKLVKTPHLDKLAQDGARYTHAFSTSPVCSPARSALMTGMYQTSLASHQHRTQNKKPLPEPIKLYTDYFRSAGYYITNSRMNMTAPGKTDFNFQVDKPFDGTDWRDRKPGQPFFSMVNFQETHRKFKRDPDNPIDPDKVKLPPYYPDHPLTRRDWADYLECVQVLDKKVGQILQRLQENGLTEDTLVLFFGDHGRPHVRGKQWLYDGGIHIPLIFRWPGHIEPGTIVDDLISAIDLGPTCLQAAGIDTPKHLQGRNFLGENVKKRDYIIAARDRCDETCDRIRCVRTKRYKYFRNFFPNLPYTQTNLYKSRSYPVLALMHVLYAQGKLTPTQEKFMASHRPAEELYDLQKDPHELNNLADDKNQQSVLTQMRQTLDNWINETNDEGEISEDPKIAADNYLKIHLPNHNRNLQRMGLKPDATWNDWLAYWEKQLLGKNQENKPYLQKG